MERVNILMSTHNGRLYVAKQIESILNQTFTNFRLIISDDASTDSTLKILEEYENKDSRIEVYRQEKRIGATSNFEFLISKVRSELFMISNQDDIWHIDKIEKSIKKMEDQGLDLVYTDLEIENARHRRIAASYWKYYEFENKIKKYNGFQSLYLNNYISSSTMLIKSKWINEFIPFPKKNSSIMYDYWIPLTVSQNGRIGYLDEATVRTRQHKEDIINIKQILSYPNSFEEMRNSFINYFIDHFKVFSDNVKYFSDASVRQLNRDSYEYFNKIRIITKCSFKDIKLFFKLFKCEETNDKINYLLLLHFPVIAKIYFNKRKNKQQKSGELQKERKKYAKKQ